MKKIIFSLLVTGILFACSDNTGLIPDVNESKPLEEGELIPVSFNMGFSKEVTPFRSGGDSEFTLKHLYHYIFSSATGYLYAKYGPIEDSNGSINCELPEGEYFSVFVAHNGGHIKIGGDWNPILTSFASVDLKGDDMHGYMNNSDLKDVFYKKIIYQVKRNEENNYPIILERLAGKIEIVFSDTIPSNITTISLDTDVPIQSFYFSKTDEFSAMGSILNTLPISDSDRISAGYTISFFALDTTFPGTDHPQGPEMDDDSKTGFSIVLEAYSGSKRIIEKEIWNVDVYRNKTVRYSGNFFVPASSFAYSLDDTWGGTTEGTY